MKSLKGNPCLIGDNTGHLKERAPGYVDDPDRGNIFKKTVTVKSVMAVVTPADYILEMLKMPEVKKQREEEEVVIANSIARAMLKWISTQGRRMSQR